MIETQLIEKKDLREQVINNVEVLNKVKKLFLIPEMNVMTTKMVADYYEVGYEAIKTCYKVNKGEIDLDGVTVKPYKDFSKVLGKPLKTGKGKATFKVSNSIIIEIPTRVLMFFHNVPFYALECYYVIVLLLKKFVLNYLIHLSIAQTNKKLLKLIKN